MIDSLSLLRRFVEQRSEEAFNELVRGHLNLVYFSALRQTAGDTHHAEDAAQATFVLLAKKASSLLTHPNFVGWLHTAACHQARDLMRTEQRRHQRELAAQAMHEISSAEAKDEVWLRVRPIFDDALQDLTPDDRDAVLLRYFENHSFAEIATALQLTENAARMRVNRALERLESALGRRGVKSTATALANALTIPAALAAPAGLATQFSTAALADAAVGAGTTVFTVIKLMSSAKLIATATSLAALCAIGTALYQHKQFQIARLETAALRQQQTDLQTRIIGLESHLVAEKTRAADADADNGRLLALTASMLEEPIKTAKSQGPITYDTVAARYKNAQALAKSGQNEEALKEFLWCYDTGMRQVGGYAGVRGSYLLTQLVELGRNYPPARAAINERRDVAEQRLGSSSTDQDAVSDYVSINHALGDDAKNLTLFTSLPADDPRRQTMGYYLGDQLVAAQRYAELIQAKPFSQMMMMFSITTGSTGMAKMTPEMAKKLTNGIANSTATDIEALAGAGDIAHASELITKLVAFDNSAETRGNIQQHLTRAGHPELLKTP